MHGPNSFTYHTLRTSPPSTVISHGVGVSLLLAQRGIRIKIPAEKKTYELEIAKGTVRRVQKREDDRIMIGIEFTEISERVRKDIIAYIFERQRSVIRKIGR